MDQWASVTEGKYPAALHIDTGMCRLGLSPQEALAIEDPQVMMAACHITLLMSHLACAATPEHPLNQQQRRQFEQVRRYFPSLPCSLANSSGHFLASDFHYDLGRPGCSLYGITPNSELPNPMQHVATLAGPILQVREITTEQPIGYGATATVRPGMRVATVALGYADGIHRIASGSGLMGYVGETAVPMPGRVSMDMTCFDVTEVAPSLLEKAGNIQLICERQTVDRVAEICHTIGYEIFTRLGTRVKRVYR